MKYQGDNLYVIDDDENNNIIKLFISPKLFSQLEGNEIKQLREAANLPRVFYPIVGLPDIHEGFGLPIGGVMATEKNNGIVSAGAVGMDINCGVRLLKTDIPADELSAKFLNELMGEISAEIPLGTGKDGRHEILRSLEIEKVLEAGVPYLVEKGAGSKKELGRIEEGGCMQGGSIEVLSRKARSRTGQLSTLGGGNHFIELCKVKNCLNPPITDKMGIYEDTLGILIHTGSRGVGHQICKDYSQEMLSKANKKELPTKGLAFAYLDSDLGKRYLKAMAAASNYAFCNRQLISWIIKNIIKEKIGNASNISLVYDVSHNIAKFERHYGKELLVHRKGTTRAFPPGHEDLNLEFKEIGQPAIIPGSMGTSTYVVMGTSKLKESFYSVNHGAGRLLSRKKAKEAIDKKTFKETMKGIELPMKGIKKYIDEAPQAYKDIHEVVDSLSERNMITKAARLVPLGVLKGD